MEFINKKKIKSWAKDYLGNYRMYLPRNINDLKNIIATNKKIISCGGLRSYGDSAISDSIISSKFFNKIISFDEDSGILKAQAGITIQEMINFLLPKGWFLKVTPGTKFATLGGCIASDVHGKEHHKEGCFSEHLLKLELLVNEKDVIKFDRYSHPDLFMATCGGMGLTGFIIEAQIQCKKIESSSIEYKKRLNHTIDEVFSCFENYKDFTYSVAWLDTKKSNNNFKSVFTYGDFCKDTTIELNEKSILSLPFKLNIINNLSTILFNKFYFFWNLINKKSGYVDYDSFFYPLDKIKNWYNLYGNNGFAQYQFLVPKISGKEAITEVLKFINDKGCLSSLAVLKLHGERNDNYISFPKSGYSLAMDFPLNKKISNIFDEMDKIVLKYNGKVYLTKDSRLTKFYFKKFYPSAHKMLQVKEKYKIFNFCSNQSHRVGFDNE